jgi:hypothetical protein
VPTIRVQNATGSELDAVRVYVPAEAQEPVDFGPVRSGASTGYREVPVAYRYMRTEVSGAAGSFAIQPYDFVGEEPLAEGRYTYRLGLVESRLTVDLDLDEPGGGP